MVSDGRRTGVSRWRLGVILLLAVFLTMAGVSGAQAAPNKWLQLRQKYRDKPGTDRLIFVKYKGGSNCEVLMFKKVKNSKGKNTWKRILRCSGYVGRNGIDKKVEGDMRTPTGNFRFTKAFGIKKNPGCKIPYIRLNQYLYWSGEKDTYNQMVDVRKLGRTWMAGEHLIDYNPAYNYSLAIGYNRKCVYKKGSAIFMHCTSGRPYTAGCVAIPEIYMKKVMRNVTKKTRICIYRA